MANSKKKNHPKTAPQKRDYKIPFLVVLFFFAFAAGAAADFLYKKFGNPEIIEAAAPFLREFDLETPDNLPKEELVPEKTIPGAVHVPILVYHSIRPHYDGESAFVDAFDITPEWFEKELVYFKDHGIAVISFGDLVKAVEEGTPLANAVVLTFDDGWENQYAYAFPLLKKYHDTATFFVFTNAVGHKHYLTWDQIRELDQAGMTIASHTKSHPYLFKITDRKTMREEIIESKKILEEHLGKPVDFFAYPFGRENDLAISVIKEAGFKAARTSHGGMNHTKADLYTLKGVQVPDNFDRLIGIIEKK